MMMMMIIMMMMMIIMMMMMMKRLCSTEHSSYDNYFLENNSLFESIYGKNHVGKIRLILLLYFQDMSFI